jgi:large conductance mechanosensitive channel
LAVVGFGLARFNPDIFLNALLLFLINLAGVIFSAVLVFSLMNFYSKRKEAVLTLKEQEEKRLKKQARGFTDFIREQGVVGLAVGLAIGTASTVFVKSIVDGIITPVIGWLLPGGTDLGSMYLCLDKGPAGECINRLSYGAVLSSFISFIAVAAVIYFVVKGLKL